MVARVNGWCPCGAQIQANKSEIVYSDGRWRHVRCVKKPATTKLTTWLDMSQPREQ